MKPELKEGEVYAGGVIRPDGTGYHLILLPGELESATWQEAMDWAAVKGGELPDRVGSALMFACMKDRFTEGWNWTREKYSASNAWCQYFRDGGQGIYGIHGKLRAVAVRRVPMEGV